jgi:hypothetical protein
MKIDILKGPSVTISASPDEWELFDADTPEEEQTRDFVADTLNRSIARIIARAPTRKDISHKDIELLLIGYKHWGTADSEGYRMVERILDRVYG